MPKDPSISIENVVASVTLFQRLDLQDLQKTFPEVEYKPSQFPGLVFRLRKPKTATLIFSSGKMVCTGAKSERESIKAVHKVVKMIKKEGFIIKSEPEIVIQNIVASVDLHGKIDLEAAAEQLDNVMYEPEQFPGLIYRMKEPKVVILMFASGKLVCTGAKEEKKVFESVYKLKGVLEEREFISYR
ncbi:MAG: TATA-box-binding protein [Nitrososphaeria archaeon]